MAPVEMSRTVFPRSLNIGAHAAFVPIGIVTVLLGPLLPILSARVFLDYSHAGSLFTAQFLGSTAGVLVSGVMVSRWGFRFAINAGLLAMAVGVGTLPFSSRSLGIVCIFCYGVGLGFSIPAINLFVAAVNPERRGAALSLLNFSWSVGAVACPFAVAAAVKADKIQPFLLMLAGVLILVLLGIVTLPSSFVEPSAVKASTLETASSEDWERPAASSVPWRARSLIVPAALFFLYVGAENGFGGWIASYAKSLGARSQTLPVMTPSFFYAALMVGRWLATLVLRKTDEIRTARAGLWIACVGMAGLVL